MTPNFSCCTSMPNSRAHTSLERRERGVSGDFTGLVSLCFNLSHTYCLDSACFVCACEGDTKTDTEKRSDIYGGVGFQHSRERLCRHLSVSLAPSMPLCRYIVYSQCCRSDCHCKTQTQNVNAIKTNFNISEQHMHKVLSQSAREYRCLVNCCTNRQNRNQSSLRRAKGLNDPIPAV